MRSAATDAPSTSRAAPRRPASLRSRGTIHETAELVTSAGGAGIAVRVDHADDDQVKALFDQVEREQGRLDILVNNAAIIRDEMMARTKLLGGTHQRHRHARCRPSQQLRRHRLRRTADGSTAQGSGRFHFGPRRCPLRVRPVLWRAQGGNGQDGRRHGGGLQGFWHRRGFDLDGIIADRARQENHREQHREIRSHTGQRRDSRADRPCHLGALQRSRSHRR